ncbi:MAG: hypothetical protein N3F67_02545 [Acidilobaceae archaeon]|nr:hypothetical protein [Acidilobaceae archaeon]
MKQKVSLLSLPLLLSLLLIGVIGALERGPVALPVYVGAHPTNEGPMGLSELYQAIRRNYSTILVSSWEAVRVEGNCKLLLLVISPEVPYTEEEIEKISSVMSRCVGSKILVADETGNANPLLSAIGSAARIGGGAQRQYPLVSFEVPWGSYVLLLDRPSPLFAHGEAKAVGVEIGVPSPQVYSFMDEKGLVIGDGSIFLNQVLRSEAQLYADFLFGAIRYLCQNCTVLLDATRAEPFNPLSIIHGRVSIEVVQLIDPVSLVISLLSFVLHPSAWLVPLGAIANRLIAEFLLVNPIRELLITATFVVLALFLASREESAADRPLREVSEVHWYGYVAFKKNLVKGGGSLGREDFISLYELFNYLLSASTGIALNSPEAPLVLEARGMDGRRAREYVSFMNKFYKRAMGKSWWPPVVFWGSTTRKALEMTEEALKALGYSIMEARGLEERVL